MADIRIQEKRRPIWPWILLIFIIIVAAVLLYMYLERDRGVYNDEYRDVPPDTARYYEQQDTVVQHGGGFMETPRDEVDQFLAFTTEDTLGTFSKEYVMNGLHMLSGALYNVVHSRDTVSGKVVTQTDSLMSYTMNLADAADRNFSSEVNKSMNTAYEIISSIQKEDYPEMNRETNELRSAVRNFDTAKPVEDQEKPVRDFFRVSGDILSNMNGNDVNIYNGNDRNLNNRNEIEM
jgi:hypothetical protein